MIGVMVFFIIKGPKQLLAFFSGFVNKPANPPKNAEGKVQPEDKSNPDSKVKSINKGVEEVNKDMLLSDESLDNAEFSIAVNEDKRSYGAIYLSLLKRKQLFI